MKKKKNNITMQQWNFILYVLLLIMTPFLLLQNYLQSAIGVASNSHLEAGSLSIPYTLIAGLIVLAVILYIARKSLRWRHLGIVVLILALFRIGQLLTDFYFNHKFYELQHNWHYLAYSVFAIISWRFWKAKGKNTAQIMRYTLIFAFGASLLDEIAQVPLSNRVFDVCDIAKDIYGAVLGNLFVFYVLEDGKNMPQKLHLVQRRIKGYLNNPLTLLVYEYLFVFIFLIFTSILSDSEYLPYSLLLPMMIFVVVWLSIHLLQFKISRLILVVLYGVLLIGLIVSYSINHSNNITYNKHGLTIYRGIPIPYYDLMIFDNGSWRLVDKKHVFNQRDQRTILTHCSDILLIGSGSQGKGGRGFPEQEAVQFVFNPNTGRMTQIIILNTPQACQVYNRLKKENKNVTFIIHNTC